MTYYYDSYGWLSDTPIEGRGTDVVPMAPEGNKRPNFTGRKWVLMDYSEPPVQSGTTLEQRNATLEERVRILENILLQQGYVL